MSSVSVVIATYNRAALLDECLAHLARQPFEWVDEVIVVNNGTYGTIRMHQERRFPGRMVATDIQNPDFIALAESFGAYAERVEASEAFPDAFRRAEAAGRPALLELRVDPVQLTPAFRIPG